MAKLVESYSKMNYKAASISSKKSPYTNILIYCSICPPNSSCPQTIWIWKYNAVNYFIIEHSSPDHPLSIPDELLVQMIIRKADEKTMGIQEQDTINFRGTLAIPDSDGHLE